jgi:soluble lytic murein transglycosylase-like protein
MDLPPTALDPVPPAPHQIVLPARLPAQCFLTSASDYGVPPLVLVAMVKVESHGKSVVSRNPNGSFDLGVAQINLDASGKGSWGRYMRERYGITPEALANNPCQSIRAQAYVLRSELNHRSCGGSDIWCGVGRYHAPYKAEARAVYVEKVKAALSSLVASGKFE